MFAIRRWPRWLREDALLRARWSTERALALLETCEVDETLECLGGATGEPLNEAQALSAEARLQWCLDQLPEGGATRVLLVEGVDADGKVHAAERLLLSCSEEEEDAAREEVVEEDVVKGEEEDATPQEDDYVTRPPPPPSPTRSPSYSPPRPSVPPTPSAPLPSPPLPSTGAPPPRPWAIVVEAEDEDDTPTWLRTPSPVEEAATDVQDAPRQEEEAVQDAPQPEEANDVEEKPNTHEESGEDASLTTRVLCEGKTVLALHGVLTPALLAALAAQRVALPTADGGARVRVFRQAGGAVRVGNYTLGAYAHGAYRATVASKRDTLPRRAAGDVARRHRAKQTAYERR